MQQLYDLFAAKLKDQGLSVIFFVGSTWFFFNMWGSTEKKLESKIEDLNALLINCDRERKDLAVEVAKMQERLNAIQLKK